LHVKHFAGEEEGDRELAEIVRNLTVHSVLVLSISISLQWTKLFFKPQLIMT